MPNIGDMKGKAAVITGAAAGLGRATALKLAGAGADVCIADVNAAGLEETAGQVRQLGRRAEVVATDLTVRDHCQQTIAAAVKAFGRLDALCNVAGYLMPSHTPNMPQVEFDKTIGVNLAAPFYLCQFAIPHLLETKGAIVNVTSCAAFNAQAYFAVYCATKAGLMHMTKALAMEYMNRGIRINAVAPGGMATALANNMRKLAGDVEMDLIKRFVPMRGLVEIDDVADMVAFLASDAARGYHGVSISVDNGVTAG
jgi:NAD(P)-dependent dehydrogenase (short-subunit alcohol dehydrogenase family)